MNKHPQINEIIDGKIICAKCEEWKSADSFALASRMKRGRHSWCKPCFREWGKVERSKRTQADKTTLNAKRRASYDPDRNRAYREKNYEAIRRIERNSHFVKKYGITVDEYEEMYERQGGKCLLCKLWYEVLAVDHCHTSGKVRALLCGRCNIGIGYFLEDPQVLRAAADWIDTLND